MKQLKDTINLMISPDYRDRLIAEYEQLTIRCSKLKKMMDDWNHDELDFKPVCPKSTYNLQIEIMEKYIAILQARAAIEGIVL